MIYVPFIYFTILFIFIYIRNKFDVSAYIVTLYIITSFFSILIHHLDFQPLSKYNLSITPTLVYCGLITLAIYPIFKFNSNTIKGVSFVSTKFINIITYFYFFSFVILLIAYKDDIIFRFTFGDFAEMRGDDDLGLKRYPGIIESFLLLIRAFAHSSYIMIFIFFFSISFLRKSVIFNLMSIIGSLPVVVIGVLGIDRSKTFFWIIILGLCMVFFWKYIERKKKIKIIPIISAILLLVIIYMSLVTNSRFGERDTGNKGGVITYAGQSYINFCYFWDNFENPGGFSTKYLFPATHYWIIGDYEGTVPYQKELHLKTMKDPGVFYSYLGSFLVDSNKPGPFIFTFLYLFLCSLAFRKKQGIIRFERLLYGFLLLIIPACGIIVYIYTSYYMTFSMVVWIFLLKLLSSRKREKLFPIKKQLKE